MIVGHWRNKKGALRVILIYGNNNLVEVFKNLFSVIKKKKCNALCKLKLPGF